MYYKLSNTAERIRIEHLFEVTFKYPHLYRPELIINGLNETNVPIITKEEPDKISLSIWGLLPEDFNDDWSSFQNLTNTLNIDKGRLYSDSWCLAAFKKRKCLIVVTGFFTSFLKNGQIYPYHIGLPDGEPFFLAGIYNRLSDGFLTCSLLLGPAEAHITKFQNLANTMPLIIPKDYSELWLGEDFELNELTELTKYPRRNRLKANPIAKDFFKNNITFDGMLHPMDYLDIPKDDGEL
ncbi:SOS response-associated peptidase [Flavobacteriaceae bacterium TP-CH-4]|uniref:Abasic site processing protein n=1 Tax=Pelagihabitans pacificus TaxID=2696054 RepID=A0A967EF42_9FLAO|nr:SOS response-associated peptidase family protein [Pelagihabitans pacificus]NHF61023.1 SOS response-associated peptidase [Pelagihabitans pacificus]